MYFNKMTLKELATEMNNFRNQLENQKFPITPAQKSRWETMKKIYNQKNIELAK